MLTIIFWAAVIAVISYVYIEIIGHEPFFNWWWRFGLKFENKWFYKPIWGCQLCFAGQNALWIFIFNWTSTNFDKESPFWKLIFFFIPEYGNLDFSVYLLIFSISISILFTLILTKTIKN